MFDEIADVRCIRQTATEIWIRTPFDILRHINHMTYSCPGTVTPAPMWLST
jgi:hypothetical protein